MDMVQFEEAHTEWLRNCKAYENSGNSRFAPNVAYAVCFRDDEYGYMVLRDLVFTANDAFRRACELSLEWAWSSERYVDYLLLDSEMTEKFYEILFSDEHMRSCWKQTDFHIIDSLSVGTQGSSMRLFVKIERVAG